MPARHVRLRHLRAWTFAASVVLNLVLIAALIREFRHSPTPDPSDSPAVSASTPEHSATVRPKPTAKVECVLDHSGRLSGFRLRLAQPVRSTVEGATPVVTASPANAVGAVYWQNSMEAFVLPKEFPGPGELVRFTILVPGTEQAPPRMITATCRTPSFRLVCAKTQERKTDDCTILSLLFNAETDPQVLLKHLDIAGIGPAAACVRINSISPCWRKADRFTVEVNHAPETRKLAVTIRAGVFPAVNGARSANDHRLVLSIPTHLEVTKLAAFDNHGRVNIRIGFNGRMRAEDIERLITVSPAVNFQAQPDGDGEWVLRGDFQPDVPYTVTVPSEIASADGRRPVAEKQYKVRLTRLDPDIRFVGKGPFLPFRDKGRLALRVRNVQSLELRAWRINPANLVTYLKDSWYSPPPQEVGPQVGALVLPVHAKLNESKTVGVPLSKLFGGTAPGAYILAVSGKPHENAGGSRWRWHIEDRSVIVWTRLGVTAVRQEERLTVWVTDIERHIPVAGAGIEVISTLNRSLGVGETDANGLCTVALAPREDPAEEPFLVLVRCDKDFCVLPLTSGYEYNLNALPSNRPNRSFPALPYEACVYSARDVYRPGETFRAHLLLRDRELAPAPGVPGILSVLDPKNELLAQARFETDKDGFAALEIPLPERARSGSYTASVHMPGADPAKAAEAWGRMTFAVRPFTPPAVKLEIDPDKKTYRAGDMLRLTAGAHYYFGTPAGPGELEILCNFAPLKTAPGLNGLHVGLLDPTPRIPPAPRTIARTDKNGRAELQLPLPKDMPLYRPLNLRIAGVFKPLQGRPVAAQTIRRFDPQPYYLGMRMQRLGDESDRFRIVWAAAAPDGAPVHPEGPLHLEIEKVEFTAALRVRDNDGRIEYDWQETFHPVLTREVPTPPGTTRGNIVVHCDVPWWQEVRATLRSPDGRAAAQCRLALWQTDAPADGAANPAVLVLQADRNAYRPGAAAAVRFTAPAPGPAFLLAAASGEVFLRQVFRAVRGANTLRFRIPRTHWGSVTVLVSLQTAPDDARARILPARCIGMLTLPIRHDDRRYIVHIDAPEQTRPGRPAAVRISLERDGRPAAGRVHLFAMEEGVLDLTGYSPPDPHQFFYGPRACELRMFDPFDALFADPDALSATPGLRVGGGLAALLRGSVHVEDRPPAGFDLGVIEVPESGVAVTEVQMPDVDCSLRITAVAFGGPAVGSARTRTVVRDRVSIVITAPRILAPGDESKVSVHVFNNTNAPLTCTVRARTDGPITVDDGGTGSFQLPPDEQGVFMTRIRADETRVGAAALVAECVLLDGAVRKRAPLVVRAPTPPVFFSGTLEAPPGRAVKIPFPKDLYPQNVIFSLQAGPECVADLGPALDWLERYPFRCAEQTTSTAFPFAVAANVLGEAYSASDLEPRVLNAVRRLAVFQLGDRGIPLWFGGKPDKEVTVYAAHFLCTARRNGYQVPDFMWNHALAAVRNLARPSCAPDEYTLTAYAHFVAARASKPLPVRAEAFTRGLPKDAAPARLLVGAALIHGDRARTGERIVRDALEHSLLDSLTSPPRSSYWIDRPVPRTALALLALVSVHPDAPETAQLVRRLRRYKKNESGRWGDTLDNALAVVALAEWWRARNPGGSHEGTILVGDETMRRITGGGRWTTSTIPSHPVRIESTGDGPLYCAWSAWGAPRSGIRTPEAHGLEIHTRYTNAEGRLMRSFSRGDVVHLSVQVKALEEHVPNVAVVCLLPGGLELAPIGGGDPAKACTITGGRRRFVDVRDDRVLCFLDVDNHQPARIRIRCRAVVPGRYAAPGIMAAAMYNADVRAAAPGGAPIVIE